jgi:hypothetical protein
VYDVDNDNVFLTRTTGIVREGERDERVSILFIRRGCSILEIMVVVGCRGRVECEREEGEGGVRITKNRNSYPHPRVRADTVCLPSACECEGASNL